MFVEKKNIQTKQTDHYTQCQEQKYISIKDKTIYFIIKIQLSGTDK